MNTPSLEEAYGRLRPMFFAALGNLARQGLVAPPSDGMDLIHDFFVEGWKGLERNFDPNKGSFEGYAYGAFVQFARPRIVRLHRWRCSLVSSEELDVFEAKTESHVESADRERVQRALAKLPDSERELLLRIATSDFVSERSLAKDFGVSRYRVHEMVVEALGHFAVSFDRPESVPSQDWVVARALWRDRRTIPEASAILNLTPQQVRAAHKRYFAFLSTALRQNQPQTWSSQRRMRMAARPQVKPLLVLLQKALTTPGNTAMLEEVRENAMKILKLLEEVDLPLPVEDFDKLPPQWVARVYEAIFQGADVNLAADVNAARAQEAHEAEDVRIGSAFRDVLLADLSEDLQYPREIRLVDEISSDEQDRLKKAPDVMAGRDVSLWWLAHGVRPLTVFLAAKSVSSLLERHIRRGVLDDSPIVLSEDAFYSVDSNTKHCSSDVLKEEISRRAECNPKVAAALYSWLVRVAQYKAWLFAGFDAEPMAGGHSVQLAYRPDKTGDTYLFWGLVAAPVNLSPTLASTR